MNKQFPWKIITALITIVLISFGGAYFLYHTIASPPAFTVQKGLYGKNIRKPPLRGLAPDTGVSGYFLVQLRASAEMSPDSGTPTFDISIENRGFSQECPGKIVLTDFRVQGADYWTEDEGAIASVSPVVCLPGTSTASVGVLTPGISDARVTLDEEDSAQSPSASVESEGKAAFIRTGKYGYIVYAGGILAKTCAEGCDAGAAAGVSVTRVARPLDEDRFVFSVPVGDYSKTISAVAVVPVMH